jgi:hypothetical protein
MYKDPFKRSEKLAINSPKNPENLGFYVHSKNVKTLRDSIDVAT